MKLLSISGGATKISGLAGAADELINNLELIADDMKWNVNLLILKYLLRI